MKILTSYDEIESLCEALIKDFMTRKRYIGSRCVDIEAFVCEYLGMKIMYETFAEPDPGRIGFFSDGKQPICVIRGKEKRQIIFPPGLL